MRRRLFNLAAAASLALMLTTAALWTRSYVAADLLQWTIAGQTSELTASRGRVAYHHQHLPAMLIRADRARWRVHHESNDPFARTGPEFGFPPEVGWYRHGFGWTTFSSAGGIIVHRFAYVPYWPIALLALPLPLAWLVRRRRLRRRWTQGLCLTCGYDLRATPPGARCPECGAVPAPPPPPPPPSPSPSRSP